MLPYSVYIQPPEAVLRLLILVAVVLAVPFASAQTDPWPLVPGNTWTYTSGPVSNPVLESTWTVLDSVVTADGRLLPRLRFEGQFATGECLVEREQVGPQLVFRGLAASGSTPCTSWPIPNVNETGLRFSLGGPAAPTSPLVIGYETISDYDSWRGYDSRGINPSTSVYWAAAGGIGLTGFSEISCGGGVPCSGWTWQLRFATVGGRRYGTPVAGEGAPAVSEALALSVGPNPVRASASLAFSLPATAEARVEVVDALGRTVQRMDLGTRSAGAGSARLDVSELAAGVYSVRLVAGDAQAGARFSVVR